ncbi:glutamate cyclase domain-containing protein [Burkholderia ubonensis]|uniref:glutamate cyclase domain-containing protein n=1 Tax=Burkholderia ubonensis TaxID=101571 RepID=UPI00076C923C|nr:glutamate cyclase domain-containing protein [Burkholderia ubonensis]KVZ52391.1 hypothetical protein WL18_29695 [Burkholderia ubonensis]KWN81701.1 hypothetical protein WM25_04720 [Burkholderia ubonensis]
MPASHDHFITELNEKVLTWYRDRGIKRFENPQGVLHAGIALACNHIRKVMLLTGFSVDMDSDTGLPLPETDGPPGTAALARALQQVGKAVIIVTDKANEAPARAALSALDEDAAQYTQFVTFDEKQGPNAERFARLLLDQHHPDAVVSIELPGRNHMLDGTRRNMRGKVVDDFNGSVDEILIQANKIDVLTIGIGDGGNEAGMGTLRGIPLAIDGSKMASAVPARHAVTAWNSNLGAEALAAIILQRHGKLDVLHTPEDQTAMIKAAMNAGAVDGVTRGNGIDEVFSNGVSGVDGHSCFVHNRMLRLLRFIVQTKLSVDYTLVQGSNDIHLETAVGLPFR